MIVPLHAELFSGQAAQPECAASEHRTGLAEGSDAPHFHSICSEPVKLALSTAMAIPLSPHEHRRHFFFAHSTRLGVADAPRALSRPCPRLCARRGLPLPDGLPASLSAIHHRRI